MGNECDLTTVDGGDMSGTLAEGYTRQLECVSGYQPTSDQDLYCGPGGVIEGPTCVEIVQCDLGVLENTAFTAGEALNDGDYRPLSCAQGYQPSEEYADLYCNGGTLEGPTCVASTAVQCDLGALENTAFTAGEALNDGDYRPLSCAQGYQPSEEYADLYCNGGTFEGPDVRGVDCGAGPLGAPENTAFTAGEALKIDYRPSAAPRATSPRKNTRICTATEARSRARRVWRRLRCSATSAPSRTRLSPPAKP